MTLFVLLTTFLPLILYGLVTTAIFYTSSLLYIHKEFLVFSLPFCLYMIYVYGIVLLVIYCCSDILSMKINDMQKPILMRKLLTTSTVINHQPNDIIVTPLNNTNPKNDISGSNDHKPLRLRDFEISYFIHRNYNGCCGRC